VAKSWPAYSKWRYETNAYQYLKKELSDLEAEIFVDEEATND